MAAGTMVSRVLGLVRTILLTTVLGATTGVGNAFGTANTLPNMVYILLAGGVLNAVLVPQMARALRQEDGGKGYTDRLLTLAMTILLGVTIVFTIAAPLAYGLMDVSANTPTKLGVAFTYLCLPQILFYGVYTLLGEALNARGRFGAFMWSPVLANVVSIAGLIWFWLGTSPAEVADPDRWTWKMIAVLAGSSTLGIIAQALVLIIPLRSAGYSFRPNFHFRGVGLRTASTIAIWAFGAVVVQQVGLIISTNVLNSVPKGYGGTLAQQNAFLLFMLPHSIVTISLVTALYTRLSHAAAEGRTYAVKADLDTGLRLSALASIAVTIGSLVLVHPLALVLFGSTNGPAIGDMSIAMMLGLVPFTICVLVQRVFYAYEDAKTPFWMQVGCTAVAIVVTLGAALLPPRWIGPGVGMAQTLSYVVQAILGWFWLQRRIGHIPVGGAIRAYVRLTAAAAAGTAVALVVRFGLSSTVGGHGRLPNLLIVVVGGGLFLMTYLLIGKRLGVEEVGQLLSPVLSRLPGGRAGTVATAAPAITLQAQPDGAAAEVADFAGQADSAGQADMADLVEGQELGELATGDPRQVGVLRPVAPLPGQPRAAADDHYNDHNSDDTMQLQHDPRFEGDDEDYQNYRDYGMPLPSLGEGVVADTAPIPLRVRLPRPRVQRRVDEPDTATTSHAFGEASAQNLRMEDGAGGQAPTHSTADGGPDVTSASEGERSVQGIESGHELAGRYLVRQAIASSETTQQWSATDQTLSRDVTVTVFDADGPHAAAALDSARRAAAVEDRHLPRVLDVGSQDNISYVVTESLAGAESIASMLQFDRLPSEEARRMIGEAAIGLHAAAARGLHHLALTPHDIVRSADGSVYIEGLPTDAALAGADEVPSAEASRRDTVALTQVLYAALTGQWPGQQEVPGLTSATRDADGDVAPVDSLRDTAPRDLSALCSTVLNDDAGPATPGDLAAQLAPWSSEQVTGPDAPSSPAAPATSSRAARAGGAAAAVGAVRLGKGDPTEEIELPPGVAAARQVPTVDPDATHTFDAAGLAQNRAQQEDDYDPSFTELEPPLPMFGTGTEDPDKDTSKLALAIVAAFLVAALVLGIIGLKGLFSGGGSGSSATNRALPTSSTGASGGTGASSPAQPTGQPVKIAGIDVFDPQGSGAEHPELVQNAIDGNASTSWRTRWYSRPDFTGGRMKGTGLILDLGKSTQVGSVKINTLGGASTIQVFVTPDKPDTVDGMTPFGTMDNKSGEQTITANTPATGRYVILWVTQLAPYQNNTYREQIAEVGVTS